MFRYNNQFKQSPPSLVQFDGFNCKFFDLTREQWDKLGWNEAIPIQREPFTNYETHWIKGKDLIYREEVLSAVENQDAKAEHAARNVRSRRDSMLAETDWTQLADSTIDDASMVLWQSYRQALRDIPQQAGFPLDVEWPEMLIFE